MRYCIGIGAESIRSRLSAEPDQAAPHVIDAEVVGAIRRDRMLGLLDPTAAAEALDAPLLTLDARLARVAGLRCAVEAPPTA